MDQINEKHYQVNKKRGYSDKKLFPKESPIL